jgi:chromosome partitioning protein
VAQYCASFKEGKSAYFIPGDAEMFAFPSMLYQQLQIANAQRKPNAMRALLESLKTILDREARALKAEGILLDTSPFYSGGTHLAWCAADAIIIPVRVDEHSIESLELTLDLLSDENKDFRVWNARAGGRSTPKVAAIVMTMVGSRSRIRSTPDRASNMYIERAIALAQQHPDLFDYEDPSDAFVITDDFVSSGRISGAKSIPISRLKVGSFHMVDGRRLQVNTSATRYQRELAYLISVI